MIFIPHLCFDGQCKEAFTEYRQIFGGEIQTMMSYDESPMAGEIDAAFHRRIVHATLLIAGMELAGVDLLPQDYKKPQGFFIAVNIPDLENARSVFDLLSKGGKIHLPFAETFWAS